MKVGIKYCGGCNPRFNRREIVEKLMDEYSDFSFEPAIENYLYDIILVINGCLSACANYSSLISKKIIIIKTKDDYINLKDVLNK